jgi:hypothetical protein
MHRNILETQSFCLAAPKMPPFACCLLVLACLFAFARLLACLLLFVFGLYSLVATVVLCACCRHHLFVQLAQLGSYDSCSLSRDEMFHRSLTVLFRRHGCLSNGRLALCEESLLQWVLELTRASASSAKARVAS